MNVTRFIAFGDSMTWGEDGQDFAGECPNEPQLFRPLVQVASPYPSLLQSKLDARYTAQLPTVKPDGNPGEAASNPNTLPRFKQDVLPTAYDAVLLMEGANDLGGSEDAAIAALGSMIDYARAQGLRVFLATIPPENPNVTAFCPTDRDHSSFVAPFNARVRALAASKNATLVDVEIAFGGNMSLLGLDGLHPTPTGYAVIANTFFAAIKATLEK
ncbi:MAG TPA: SGNH/GDSL hydrolase family protein [Vicinamibacterales bacterium]|nr:SGNH/GDSL hydrolase family protein [Vicinamibacterales bacterium]